MNAALLARLAGRPMALAPRALEGCSRSAPEARGPFPAMWTRTGTPPATR